MTRIPQLERDLVRAADTRQRRTSRPVLHAAVALSALAALVAAIGVAIPPSDREVEVAAGPSADASLSEHFAVLRRPRTAADRLPAKLPKSGDADSSRARRVGSSSVLRIWLVPGKKNVCVVTRFVSAKAGSTGCGLAAAAYNRGEVAAAGTIVGPWRWRPHRLAFYAVVPDGVRSVRLVREGRMLRQLAVRNNAVEARVGRATHAEWTGADGTAQRLALSP